SLEKTRPLSLGTVVHGARRTQTPYTIDANGLTRHAFVAGVTGSGKTNTVFHLLKETSERGIPFLVIEPTKAEYRSLLNHSEVGNRLQVFTLGNELVSPFRMNLFEPMPGTPVAVHLDLLRSAFGAGFGMWTPLPQVMERSLHRIYRDRGWDIATDS